jgi:hypothetical protein
MVPFAPGLEEGSSQSLGYPCLTVLIYLKSMSLLNMMVGLL